MCTRHSRLLNVTRRPDVSCMANTEQVRGRTVYINGRHIGTVGLTLDYLILKYCYLCHQPGHIRRNCHLNKRSSKGSADVLGACSDCDASGLVTDEQRTGKFKCYRVLDGSMGRAETAVVDVESPVYTGKFECLCISSPVCDLIVGNVPGVISKDDAETVAVSTGCG